MEVTKAVVMVAGWGTRMLPITKSIEKCMLPIGNRPVIDFIVQDIIAAGIKDIYFVVGEQSAQLQSYYRSNIPLIDYLKRKGKTEYIPLIAPLRGVNIHFLTQPSTGRYGTSVPASIASEYIDEGESALLMNGDQFFLRQDQGSNAADLIRLARDNNVSSGIYGNPVPMDQVQKFGIIEKDANDHFVRIVEKPAPEEAPSNLNNSGFYLLHKEVFKLAETLPANPKRNEYEITDAINAYVDNGGRLIVGELKGEYMECGSVAGWLHANNVICGNA